MVQIELKWPNCSSETIFDNCSINCHLETIFSSSGSIYIIPRVSSFFFTRTKSEWVFCFIHSCYHIWERFVFFSILVVFGKGRNMGVNSNRVEHFACPETTLTIPAELGAMQIHDVCLPPEKTTFHKLKHRLSEIFFPDDPLYRFKNQTCFNKLILALQFFFPIFQWGSEYNVSLLRSDVISGLTIASLAIPQVRETMKLLHHPLSLFVCVCVFFFFFLITGGIQGFAY